MPVSGIRGTHDIPLGSHLCLFYRRPKEFLQVTASFLKAGLTERELCVWVLPPPLTILLAIEQLSYLDMDGPSLQATNQLQIVSASDWYAAEAFDVKQSLDQLSALPALAHHFGYASVRAVGGPGPFLSQAFRQSFMRYEQHVTEIIATLPIIGLCCYASSECLQTDMFNIMSAHPGALVRTYTGWASI